MTRQPPRHPPPPSAPRRQSGQAGPAQAVRQARELLVRGQLEAAGALIDQRLAQRPNDTDALHVKAVLLNLQGQAAQALPLIERALQATPDDAGRWNDYGMVLDKLGQRAQAIAAFERSVEKAGASAAAASAYNNLGRILREVDPTRAVAAWQRATQLAPGQALAWHQLSEVLPELGRVAEGVDAWARATVLAPERASTEHHARALVHLGRTQEAIALYQKQLARNPQDARARHHLDALLHPQTAERASDAYVQTVFDAFAANFDAQLARLNYRAPGLVRDALAAVWPQPAGDRAMVDAGCGTGLCGPLLAPWARRLVGFDLSADMLAQARQRAAYQELHQAEWAAFLGAQAHAFDAVVSADTLCYFAGLSEPLQAAACALQPGGLLIWTTEALADAADAHRLLPSGRYAHSQSHVTQAASAAGLHVLSLRCETLREEAGQPVSGWLVTLQRPG